MLDSVRSEVHFSCNHIDRAISERVQNSAEFPILVGHKGAEVFEFFQFIQFAMEIFGQLSQNFDCYSGKRAEFHP